MVLFERAVGATRWNRVTSKPTPADDVVAFRRSPTVATSYRLQFAGEGLQLGGDRYDGDRSGAVAPSDGSSSSMACTDGVIPLRSYRRRADSAVSTARRV